MDMNVSYKYACFVCLFLNYIRRSCHQPLLCNIRSLHLSLSSALLNVNLARLPLWTSNMATSRLEINFIRLLSRCESLASEKRNETEWRLEKVTLIHNNTAFACTSVLLKQMLYFLLDTTKQYLPSPFLYELTLRVKNKTWIHIYA